jgi:hypothetical protein
MIQRALGLIAVVLLGVGLGRISAAEPVFPADKWSERQPAAGDVAGPGRCAAADGRTLRLVFSSNDCFSVRKATLRLKE